MTAKYRPDPDNDGKPRLSPNELEAAFGQASATDIPADAPQRQQASQRMLSELIDHCPLGIYLVDSSFTILMMNRRSEEGAFVKLRPALGRRLEEAMYILWPREVAHGIIKAFRKTLETGEPSHSRDFAPLRPDKGQAEVHEWELHPVTLPDGDSGVICYDFDTTALRTAEQALRDSEARLHEELRAKSRLEELSARLVRQGELKPLLQEILAAAADLTGTDKGNIQIYNPQTRMLRIVVHQGLGQRLVEHFAEDGWGASCSKAASQFDRVVVEDTQKLEHLRGTVELEIVLEDDIRSIQCTPLVSRDGRLLGMLNNHYRVPGRPDDEKLRYIDLLARQAADLIERHQGREQMEADLAAMTRLQKIGNLCAAQDADQEACIAAILDAAIELTGAARGKLQLLDEPSHALRIVAQRGFERPYLEFLESVDQTHTAACAAALRAGQRVVVADVTKSELFVGTPALKALLEAQVRAVQSSPLISSTAQVLGMISTHFPQPHTPSDRELRLMDLLARQAADFLERCKSKRAVTAARQAAEAANLAKDRFLATLSHELRTPLTPILATLSAWEKDQNAFPQSMREDLAMLRRNLELEARLIDDLLDLTRIAKGKIALDFEIVKIRPLVDSVLRMFTTEISHGKLELVVRHEADQGFVRADSGRIQQAVWNLVKNAVKFTPPGGRIEVVTRRDAAGREQIIVSDTGIGIPADFLDRLFTPFAQACDGSKNRHGGLGLGLAIVKALVEAHDGTIEVQSPGANLGTTFTITLPSVEASLLPAGTCSASASDAPRLAEAPQVKHFRVLLIEDHADTALVLARILRHDGHDVTTARSVSDAMSTLRSKSFDVLLSDIGLPDGSGIDLIRQVRQQYGLTTPAIAITGYGMEDDVAQTLQAGFNEHLTKPINLARLEEVLHRVCGN